jgi:hydrogenase expression/formation protein HypE
MLYWKLCTAFHIPETPAVIGEVTEENPGKVVMHTPIGGETLLPQPGGELLPRIC